MGFLEEDYYLWVDLNVKLVIYVFCKVLFVIKKDLEKELERFVEMGIFVKVI